MTRSEAIKEELFILEKQLSICTVDVLRRNCERTKRILTEELNEITSRSYRNYIEGALDKKHEPD